MVLGRHIDLGLNLVGSVGILSLGALVILHAHTRGTNWIDTYGILSTVHFCKVARAPSMDIVVGPTGML